MSSLIDIPIDLITALSPERAVKLVRTIFRAECGYAKLNPSNLTISSRLTVADGGIDAEINTPAEHVVPTDCFFQTGLSGFQIKAGQAFKPWTRNAIRTELLNAAGELSSEVRRLVQRGGRYVLICTGHDLTPAQRNDSRDEIVGVLAELGFEKYEDRIDILGASQLAEYAERYPGSLSLLSIDFLQEAWSLGEWQQDAHMSNALEESPEQSQLITQIRDWLSGETKHIRILGEPGLGKTRIVLEAVKAETIAPSVLYVPHGIRFGQTSLFRQLLKSGHDKPLILVIDELPESELSEIWRHLKPRCGILKIISLDHGRDITYDTDIERVEAPHLTADTIKRILASRVGESHELERWAEICDGSPRVAQAVAENLHANPDDLLKPPTTVPIWSRFMHGYSGRDENSARQIDCISQHLALFTRFGYETPVSDEARYIFELINSVDPTIGWARFQEIIQNLRSRRVLQGSRTLFFVPKALHIYLWKQFWEQYGQGFDFTQTFTTMPDSLHAWFMSMFKYAGDTAADHVIVDILRTDGIFSQRVSLTSDKGSRFLSILAEANPKAVLKLLETAIGKLSDQELLEFSDHRQQIVWALEKIAVWPGLTVRAIQILARLSLNENSNYSNNSTGTLKGLFRIGPEWAATESSPDARLPAAIALLRAPDDTARRLGLKVMKAALTPRGGYRIIGPEYQGLKERAKLWIPNTYGELWQAWYSYFQVLVKETRNWPHTLRPEVCSALLDAVNQQIMTPPCTDLAFQVLNDLVDDKAMLPGELNHFFQNWREYRDDGEHPDITRKLIHIERQYTRRNLASRFQRYVIDTEWMEWDDNFRERHNKTRNRAKLLVNALALRISRNPEHFRQIQHLLTPEKQAPALWHFGEKLALNDPQLTLLPVLIRTALDSRHHICLHGYLSALHRLVPTIYMSTVNGFFNSESTAWLGATIALRSDYKEELFVQCLDALEKRWIDLSQFIYIRYGRAIESVPPDKTARLFNQLSEYGSRDAQALLIELLNSLSFHDSSPFTSDFVYGVVSSYIPHDDESCNQMSGYHWKNVCVKLINWDETRTLPLLDTLLTGMMDIYSLSYDTCFSSLANELVDSDPSGAWNIISSHFEAALPKWRSDLCSWLKGGMTTFDEKEKRSLLSALPTPDILAWIEKDPESRAALIAHAVPATLDDANGGQLTRELLIRYSKFEGVQSGISATFHSGGWSGPTSAYLKRKRDKLRRWLASEDDIQTTQWIESEIEYLDKNIEDEEIKEERDHFD
jgi:hypothetical protein